MRFFWPENFSYEILLRKVMFHLSAISCSVVTKTNLPGVHTSYFCSIPAGLKWRSPKKYLFSLMNFTHAVLNIWLQDSILTTIFKLCSFLLFQLVMLCSWTAKNYNPISCSKLTDSKYIKRKSCTLLIRQNHIPIFEQSILTI